MKAVVHEQDSANKGREMNRPTPIEFTPRGFFAIGLQNAKDPANIGAALRAAGCYGASLVTTSGQRYRHAGTNTVRAERKIPFFPNVNDIQSHRPHGTQMVVVELVEGATPLPDFIHPERAFYVFGPEDGSVRADTVAAAQHIVSIPTAHCMNLAATVNVVLYDRLCKATQRHQALLRTQIGNAA